MNKIMISTLIMLLVCVGFSGAASTMTFTPPDADLYDLDHAYHYAWNIDLGTSNDIVAASITLNDIYDWRYGNDEDVLFVNLLDDWFGPYGPSYVYHERDNTSSTMNEFGDQNLITTLEVTDDIGIGSENAKTITINFNSDQLVKLNEYAVDGKIALGFDPDCHFYNSGVSFSVTVVPAPGAILLAGFGMSLVGFLRKRKNFQV